MDMQLKLDGTLWHVETGRFPDGAVWAKVKGDLPSSASLMQIRATAMKNMDDFMLLAQLVEAVRHGCDVRFSHLELPWLPYARQDRHMQPGDSFALKVFASLLNTLAFDKVWVLDPHSEAAAAAIDNLVLPHCVPASCYWLRRMQARLKKSMPSREPSGLLRSRL